MLSRSAMEVAGAIMEVFSGPRPLAAERIVIFLPFPRTDSVRLGARRSVPVRGRGGEWKWAKWGKTRLLSDQVALVAPVASQPYHPSSRSLWPQKKGILLRELGPRKSSLLAPRSAALFKDVRKHKRKSVSHRRPKSLYRIRR